MPVQDQLKLTPELRDRIIRARQSATSTQEFDAAIAEILASVQEPEVKDPDLAAYSEGQGFTPKATRRGDLVPGEEGPEPQQALLQPQEPIPNALAEGLQTWSDGSKAAAKMLSDAAKWTKGIPGLDKFRPLLGRRFVEAVTISEALGMAAETVRTEPRGTYPYFETLGQAGGVMLPALAMGPSAPGVAVGAALFGSAFFPEAIGGYEQALADGMTEDQATAMFYLYGAGAAGIEQVGGAQRLMLKWAPVGKAIERINKATGGSMSWVINAYRKQPVALQAAEEEQGEEYVNQILYQILAEAMTDEDIDHVAKFTEAAEEMGLKPAFAGSLLGGGMQIAQAEMQEGEQKERRLLDQRERKKRLLHEEPDVAAAADVSAEQLREETLKGKAQADLDAGKLGEVQRDFEEAQELREDLEAPEKIAEPEVEVRQPQEEVEPQVAEAPELEIEEPEVQEPPQDLPPEPPKVETPTPERPPAEPVGIKNEAVDKQRAKRGVPPVMQAERLPDQEVWDQAMREVDETPGIQDALVSELNRKPRAINPEEEMLILQRLVALENAHTQILEKLDQKNLPDSDRAAAEMVEEDLAQRLLETEEAAKVGGTQTARSLAIRRVLAKEDFTLARMASKKRKAKAVKKLSPEDFAAVKEWNRKIRDLQRKLDEATAVLEAEQEVKEEEKAAREKDKTSKKKAPTEEQRLKRRKAAIKKKTEEYRKRVEKGDFVPRTKKPVKLDREGEGLRFELEKAKLDFGRALAKDRNARRTKVHQFFLGTEEVLNVARAIVTSMDFSAVLRQGGILAMSHPIIAAKSLAPMFRSFRSEAGASKAMLEIMQRENFQNGTYKRSGLQLTSHTTGQILEREEVYMSYLSQFMPGVGASERAYVIFLNKLRADVFDALAGTLGKDGGLTDMEAEVLGNFINVATGRGNMGRFAAGSRAASVVFFSPRYALSRLQYLSGQPLWHPVKDANGDVRYNPTKNARKVVLKEYARTLTGLAIFYSMVQLALSAMFDDEDWDIEWDRRSSDFGKIRIGRTRIDPLMGLNQWTVLFTRLGTGESKSTKTGKVKPIKGEDVPWGSMDVDAVLWRFTRYKFSPVFGTAINLIAEEDPLWEPFGVADVPVNLAVPLSFREVYDVMKEHGFRGGAAIGILQIFGMGTQVHD